MKYIYKFFIGILIGCGAILPGVSSGVFCVIFGIYEHLVDCITNIFKDFKNSFLFLLPIGLGSVVGMVLFGNIIKYFFFKYKMEASFVFIGLILGTIPILFKEVSFNKKNIKKIIPMIFSFSFGILLIIFEKNFNFDIILTDISSNPIYLIIARFYNVYWYCSSRY